MKRAMILVLLTVLAVAVAGIAPFVNMPASPEISSTIFWKLHVPRVAMAMLAGAGLAVSGMVFQAVFRNALATPFTLGVASGASLGVSIYIHLGLSFSVAGISCGSCLAFAGAMATIFAVYGLTRLRRGFSSATMLLAGVALNLSFSSLVLFLQYRSDFAQSFVILRWIMGGLQSVVGLQDVLAVLPFVAAGMVIVAYLIHELNLLAIGEELAASRGVEVDRTKIALFFAVSLMVGAIVAVCGPIGFVGLMAPHICRLLIGPDHRYLAPASVLFGAAFLTVCDTVARTAMAPAELPVGILTSLLGGPFFLWLLRRWHCGDSTGEAGGSKQSTGVVGLMVGQARASIHLLVS